MLYVDKYGRKSCARLAKWKGNNLLTSRETSWLNLILYQKWVFFITGMITVNFLIQNNCQQKDKFVFQSCTVYMKRIIIKLGLELLALRSTTVHLVLLLLNP